MLTSPVAWQPYDPCTVARTAPASFALLDIGSTAARARAVLSREILGELWSVGDATNTVESAFGGQVHTEGMLPPAVLERLAEELIKHAWLVADGERRSKLGATAASWPQN
jgi:hypothetical protein